MKKENNKIRRNRNTKKKEVKKVLKKSNNYVFLIILFGIILFLLLAAAIVIKWYLPTKKHTIDYLSFKTRDYKTGSNVKELISDDGNCIISVTSQMNEINLNDLGDIIKINNHDWVKQEFSNGYTFISSYKKMVYIVQMYALDNDTFNNVCRRDFNRIQKTFSFIKDE